MPTPKNKFLEAVWERITRERDEFALYRKHVRGEPDDVEKLPEEKPKPKPPPAPKLAKEEPPLSQDQLAQISFLTWDHYAPHKIAELMHLSASQVTKAIKKMKLFKRPGAGGKK